MIKYLKEDNFDEEIKSGLTLVDFYADWCGPCQMLGKVLESLNLDFDILKVNVDQFPEIAMNYGVMNIPTLILVKDGDAVAKLIGMRNREDLLDFIKKNR